ncbi:hypothetical protein WDR88_003597 [Enterobacter cloacae]|nr:hypothetical protein [Enterobacter cloacae]
MNFVRKVMFKLLSGTSKPANPPDAKISDMLKDMADKTPALRPYLAELSTGQISASEFERVCIAHMCRELYAFRKEEEDSRMQAW